MIYSYDFGNIVINGKEYTSDVIIFFDKVVSWVREEGHELKLKDIGEVLILKPRVLIIGTGYSGVMKVFSEVKNYCKENKIRLIIEKTTQAVDEYNKIENKKGVVAILHLTC